MAAVKGKERFYVDESATGLGKALAAARQDTIHVGHPLIPECPFGIADPEWMAAVAARDLIVISRDRRIRSRPGEMEMLREAGLRVFFIGGSRDQATWEWLQRVVRLWDRMEEVIDEAGPGPWCYMLHDRRISPLVVR
ncbi:MAG: hypothetical protein V9E83_06940 [Baekduia sp.]